MAARWGHCPEIPFESEPATISQDGQASLSRKSHYLESAGAEPAPATKGVRALYTRTAREDGLFVLFVNYHWLDLLLETSIPTMWVEATR